MKSRRRPVLSDQRLKDVVLDYLSESAFISDCGPAERWQHTGRLFEVTDHAGVVAARASEECVLDVLHLQGHINGRMLTAALRFKADFIRADLGAHLVGAYSPTRGMGKGLFNFHDRSPIQEEGYQSWRAAALSVGEMLCDTVITVACHDIAPDDAHMLMLQMGLIKLAGHYKIPKSGENVDQTAARKVRVWSGTRSDRLHGRRLLH